jgi:hypothetical protein
VVGIDRGVFNKYGIDAQMIRVRSGALSIAALVSIEVEAVWPAQSTIFEHSFRRSEAQLHRQRDQ